MKTGDVLVNSTGTGTVGRTRLFDEKYLGNYPFVVPDSHVSVVRTHKEIDSYFVFSYISSFKTQHYLENNLAGTTNQKELYIGILADMLFPLPPLEEQKRISNAIISFEDLVKTLDCEKEDLKAKIKQTKSKILDLAIHGKLVSQDPADEPAIELLKRINPDFVPADNSHYGQLPNGWVTSRLNKIAQIITGNTPSKNHKEYYGNEIPFYKPTDLEQGRYMKYASEYLSALGGTMTRIVPENSVAICCIGSIGKCAYVMQTGATNQQINTIITSKAVLPLYLYYLCCSTTFITLLNSESSAITISIVNKSKLGNIPIPIPPYKEQLRIVEQIEKQYAILDSITAEL